MKKAKKFIAIIGVVCGIITIILGICVMKNDSGYWQDTSVSFGGDFYSYSYKATARAANNVLDLTAVIRDGLAYLLMSVGAFMSLYFGNLTIKALEAVKPISAPQSESPLDETIEVKAPINDTEETE